MRASIIIPCYNSSRTIAQCLASVTAQEADFDYEVVVFDSSTDGTDAIVARDFPGVTLIRAEERTMAGDARNVAVAHSTGEIICFIDSDCVAPQGWLQGIVDELSRCDAEIIQGGARPANPEALLGLASFIMEFRECNHLRKAGTVAIFMTCALAITRQAFDKYGPFPENMWPNEDTVMSARARGAGAEIVFCPEHTVAHINRARWAHVFGHQRVLGYSSAQARDVMPEMPARWMLNKPWLACLVVPFARPVRTMFELGRDAPRSIPTCLVLLPLMWLNCLAWCRGFLSYVKEKT